MKRFLCLILSILIALSILGCGSEKTSVRSPINYYYRVSEVNYSADSSIIVAEIRESFGHEKDHKYLVEQYLNGPTSSDCISPFPAGTQLEHLDYLNDTVLVVLSSHISLLTGSDLSIACTCLARTILEMTDMEEVKISSKDDLLDGSEFIVISAEDFSLIDEHKFTP